MSSTKQISTIVHEMLIDDRGSAKMIAAQLGKPYPTLMRELNPWDKGAKLGADTLLEIMAITNNYEPLEYIAKNLGMRLVKEN
jgi:hypothetical protein